MQSTHKGAEAGKFVWTAGKFYGDAEKDKGIQTSQDAKFYALSSEFKPASTQEKPLVVQFTVKHEQNIDCGGGYAKLFDCSLDQTDMHGESPYKIMFGEYANSKSIIQDEKKNFLTAISFAIAVLEVGPKLRTFALLSFVEHC